MKKGDSSTCLACIVYNWGVNSGDDNKRLVMGTKNAVTSLHEKLFDLQGIQTSWVVEFRSPNANLPSQIKTKIISHVYYYINLIKINYGQSGDQKGSFIQQTQIIMGLHIFFILDT
jgi:hypothetical protein